MWEWNWEWEELPAVPKKSDFFFPCCSVTHPNHVLHVQLLLDFAIVDFHGTAFLNTNHLSMGLSSLICSCFLAACPGLSWFKDLTEHS